MADFEKTLTIDKDFNQFISSTIELKNLTYSHFDPTSIIKKNFEQERITLTSTDIEIMKGLKTIEELGAFYDNHGIENSNKILALLEEQSRSYLSFLKKNPEFKNISAGEKKMLFTTIVKNYGKQESFITFYKAPSFGKTMVADPLYNYNVAVQGCKDDYFWEFTSIWAAAEATILTTGVESLGTTAAGAFLVGTLLTAIAHAKMNSCFDNAADVLISEIYVN